MNDIKDTAIDKFKAGDAVRVIWRSSGDHLHCLLGNILKFENGAIWIEYVNHDSILGTTNLAKILKNDVVDIVGR